MLSRKFFVAIIFFIDSSSSSYNARALWVALINLSITPSTLDTYPCDFGPGSTLIPASGIDTVEVCDLTTLEFKLFLFIVNVCFAGSFF